MKLPRPQFFLFLVFFSMPIATPAAETGEKKDPDKKENPKGTVIEKLEDRFDEKELQAFLARRTNGAVTGNLNSYLSLLYAMNTVALVSEKGFEAENRPLNSPYPESYRPTWKEKIDMICRQIGAKWKYDHATGYWMLSEGPMPLPYKVTAAEDWKSSDRGDHVVFIPPNAPVGMDVYLMGHYTPEKETDAKAVFDSARTHVAEIFAKNFDDKASVKSMKAVKVADADALFFTAPAPARADLTWRQWVFVKDGWCFAIVSVISDENEAANLPAVEKMVESFRMAGEKESK